MKVGILFIGLLFLVNGILVLRRKRYGPEEGMRGILFTGKTAIYSGIILTVIGVILIILGLIIK